MMSNNSLVPRVCRRGTALDRIPLSRNVHDVKAKTIELWRALLSCTQRPHSVVTKLRPPLKYRKCLGK